MHVKSCDESCTKNLVLQSLSDDLKKNSEGRNPRIRKKEQCQLQAKEQCQQQAKKCICDGSEKIGVRDKAAVRRNAVLVRMRRR